MAVRAARTGMLIALVAVRADEPECTILRQHGAADLGRRLHRQRLHHAVSHPLVAWPCATPTSAASGAPTAARAEEAAALARELRVGDAQAFALDRRDGRRPGDRLHLDLRAELRPRREHGAHRCDARRAARELVGIACEKPLGRNAAEADAHGRARRAAGVLHGYLENQLFAPGVERGKAIVWARGAALAGRPYLARAAEEHGGPHMPWFWRGDLQGGGVLNDMMCHSLEVGRYLLTEPGAPRRQHPPDEGLGADRLAQVVAAGIRRRCSRR